MHHPLAEVRVLDFSRAVAGPFAGRLLSDLGADVVKVEPPDGDLTRWHGRVVNGISGYFQQQNAGKRNICLDLRKPDAVDIAKSLAGQADIVIENYRAGVMTRLGLGYPTLKAIKPDLIMLSISGFGQSGPESHRPSYAPVVHAEAGLAHRLAARNNTPPGDLPLSVADTNASLHGVIAILAALRLREQTGIGQHIDLAMMDATLATDDRAHYDLEDVPDSLPAGPIIDLPFGKFLLATDMKLLFRRLHKHAGVADPTTDESTLDEKIQLREEAILTRLAACGDRATFGALMDTLNIPWGEVRDRQNLAQQPTLKHRNAIVQVDDRGGGKHPVPQSPYRFSNAQSGLRGPASHLGEHNDEVLREWLGLGAENIQALRTAEAIRDGFGDS